jgi:hypothetical protein
MQKLYVSKLCDLLAQDTSVRSNPVGASSRPRTRQLDLNETDFTIDNKRTINKSESALKASALKT